MRQKGLEPNVVTYSAAVSACEKAKQPEKVVGLLEEMWQEGQHSHQCMREGQAASQGDGALG